jgi:hypothetical protein
MKSYIVYQQIVTAEQVIGGAVYDKTVDIIIRKVNASSKEFAIEKFEKNTQKIKAIRRSKIGCVEYEKVETLI